MTVGGWHHRSDVPKARGTSRILVRAGGFRASTGNHGQLKAATLTVEGIPRRLKMDSQEKRSLGTIGHQGRRAAKGKGQRRVHSHASGRLLSIRAAQVELLCISLPRLYTMRLSLQAAPMQMIQQILHLVRALPDPSDTA